jgi:hypothetical protein
MLGLYKRQSRAEAGGRRKGTQKQNPKTEQITEKKQSINAKKIYIYREKGRKEEESHRSARPLSSSLQEKKKTSEEQPRTQRRGEKSRGTTIISIPAEKEQPRNQSK